MPAPHVRAETSAISAAAADANGVAELLASQLNSLMSRLEPTYTAWQGLGGSRFQAVKETVNVKLTDLRNALNFLATAVGESSVTYADTDTNSEDVMRQVDAVASSITAAMTPGRSSV